MIIWKRAPNDAFGVNIEGLNPMEKITSISLNSPELMDAEYIAGNSNIPFVLHRLSQHCNPNVRIAVGDNRNTHTITLVQLARDDNPDVRFALAENHQIDSIVLEILAKDENPFVANRAIKTLTRLEQTITDPSARKPVLSEKLLN